MATRFHAARVAHFLACPAQNHMKIESKKLEKDAIASKMLEKEANKSQCSSPMF